MLFTGESGFATTGGTGECSLHSSPKVFNLTLLLDVASHQKIECFPFLYAFDCRLHIRKKTIPNSFLSKNLYLTKNVACDIHFQFHNHNLHVFFYKKTNFFFTEPQFFNIIIEIRGLDFNNIFLNFCLFMFLNSLSN